MTAYSAVQRPVENAPLAYVNPVTFHIEAVAEPSVIPRILENFALRNMVPEKVDIQKQDNMVFVKVMVDGLSDQIARHLELRMQNILPVSSVSLEFLTG